MIFETHAHYDDKMFDEDRESLLESMQEAGIGRIVNIGADLASTASSIALAEKYPFIYAAAGVHPSDAAQLNEHTFQWLSGWITIGKKTRRSEPISDTGSGVS